jgi:hypothetical protein
VVQNTTYRHMDPGKQPHASRSGQFCVQLALGSRYKCTCCYKNVLQHSHGKVCAFFFSHFRFYIAFVRLFDNPLSKGPIGSWDSSKCARCYNFTALKVLFSLSFFLYFSPLYYYYFYLFIF